MVPMHMMEQKQEFKDYKGDNGRNSIKTTLLNLDLLEDPSAHLVSKSPHDRGLVLGGFLDHADMFAFTAFPAPGKSYQFGSLLSGL